MYLIIHTMTISKSHCIIQAQFYHTVNTDGNNALLQANDFRLVGSRISMRIHPTLRSSRNKLHLLQRTFKPNLKTLMKRTSHIKHQLRAVHIGNVAATSTNQIDDVGLTKVNSEEFSSKASIKNPVQQNVINNDQLQTTANPSMTAHWLTINRFEKYLPTFQNFCGADMFRMSRDDFIQICGHADGIRLYNALHSKAITPKLTLYVCRENSSVFNAVFLTTLNNNELLQKLSILVGISQDQVRDIYLQGPQSIHIQLNNDVLQHIKEETTFLLKILQDNGNCIFVLKPVVK